MTSGSTPDQVDHAASFRVDHQDRCARRDFDIGIAELYARAFAVASAIDIYGGPPQTRLIDNVRSGFER